MSILMQINVLFFFIVLKYRLCGGDWINKVLAKEMYAHLIDMGNGVVNAKGWGGGMNGGGAKGDKWGISATVSTLNT